MSLRYALLGLLAEEPASGYDLTRKFEVLRRYAWHAQSSQIYPELSQLSSAGLVSVVERGPRGRQTYAITEAGRAQLREWLRHPRGRTSPAPDPYPHLSRQPHTSHFRG